MTAIGGYFELEINKRKEYHENALVLNTGRNAFEYIILANSYTKIYLPFFSCCALLEPLKKHSIVYEFYSLNEHLEPIFNYSSIKSNEGFLYINYFGLKDNFVKQLSKDCKNIIIDAVQSFYFKPIKGIDMFNSPRKFFGVPDGAYLFTDKSLNKKLEKDVSFDRCTHLLKRLDSLVENGYQDFVDNEISLGYQEIKEMSNITKALLSKIDYNFIKKKRRKNFSYLHSKLKESNNLEINLLKKQIPMVYPYKCKNLILRKKLLRNKIFTAVYWPNILKLVSKDSFEYSMVIETVYLPIDQRYSKKNLKQIVKIIKNEY